MPAIHHHLRETHRIGPATREWIVSPDTCPALREHGIRMLGRSEAGPGFRFVRARPEAGQVLACVSGRGRAWAGGAWAPVRAGTAYLTPPGAPHAYAAEGRRWSVAWVMFHGSASSPLAALEGPRVAAVDAQPLWAAIRELHRESVGAADLGMMRQWAGLIHSHAARACGRGEGEPRLLALWEAVDADLARPWTLDELARLVGVSGEHLRRLCLRRHGCTPMRRLTEMRLRRAAGLLVSTPWKIDAVARAVGYDNAFAFSTAFKRATGATPSGYRRRPG